MVGTGNSGVEIATLLAEQASIRSAISVRTAPLMLKRALGPIPITVLADFRWFLPDRLIDWLGRTAHPLLWRRLAPYGLHRTTKRLSMMRHTYYSPPLDSGFAAAIQRGAIEVVPGVVGFDGGRVISDHALRRPLKIGRVAP